MLSIESIGGVRLLGKLVTLNVSIVVITVLVFIIKLRQLKRKESGQQSSYEDKKIANKYVFYRNNIFTRKHFRRVVTRYSSMACYEIKTVRRLSIKLFEKALMISIAMPLLALLAFQNSMLAILAGFVGYIYYEMSVDSAIDKEYREIIEECSYSIQSLHDEYQVTRNIPQAVLNCDRGKKLEQPMNTIYEILVDANGLERLHQFKQVSPVRVLGTLATVCHISNEEGDEGTGENESAFLRVLTSLRREADTEVRRLAMTEAAFNSLSILALVGLIASPLADYFLLSQIPGTAMYINGMYGSIQKAILIGVTIAAYYVISIIKRPTVVNQVDKVEWIDSLSKHKKVRTFVDGVKPKKFRTVRKVENNLKGAISSKSLQYIYTAKVVYSMIGLILGFILMTGFVLTAKSRLYNNYTSLSFLPASNEMSESDFYQLKKMDNDYLSMESRLDEDGKMAPPLDEETAIGYVKSKMTGLSDFKAMEQIERINLKYLKYHQIGLKWYYVLVVYLFAVAGWYIPEISLLLRKKLIIFEATEDTMQLQTLMIALANTQVDTMTALYWLMTESTIHKSALHFAYIEFPSDPEFSMERLKDSVESKDLRRIIGKLEKTITELSLEDAFSDIILDKEQSLILNEMMQKTIVNSKKEWARLLASAPIAIALIGGFIGPILLLGVNQLLNSFQSMM